MEELIESYVGSVVYDILNENENGVNQLKDDWYISVDRDEKRVKISLVEDGHTVESVSYAIAYLKQEYSQDDCSMIIDKITEKFIDSYQSYID